MEYYVVNDLFAAMMGKLSKIQLTNLLELYEENSKDVRSRNKYCPEIQRNIFRVEYRDNWEKSEFERKLSLGEEIFHITYIKIVPASITKTRAPKEFREKCLRFQEMEKMRASEIPPHFRVGLKQIKRCLEDADKMRKLYPSAPPRPKPNSIEARMKLLYEKNPKIVNFSAEKIATLLDCSKSSIIATGIWRNKIMRERLPYPEITLCDDLSQIADERLD